MKDLHISLKPDIIFDFFGLPITNSFLLALLSSIVLVFLLWFFSRNFKIIPSKTQLVFEIFSEGIKNYVDGVLDNEKMTKVIAPFILSVFLFIFFLNIFKFFPGIESLKFEGHHFFRATHSDLNMTMALSFVAFILIQYFGFFVLGFNGYSKKFLNFKKPLSIPLGLVELISEFAKLISLGFRLFGNILVGGILLLLLGQIFHFLLPLPIIFFEIFVALLQASIFSILTLFYIKLAISPAH